MRWPVVLCLLGWPMLAIATGPLTPPDDRNDALDFSLYFDRATTPLDYAGRTQDSTISRLGFSLREKAGKYVTLGLYGGNAWLTQTSNPVTAGIELDGYHAGVSLHAVLLRGQHASLYGALEYSYQKVEHKTDSQTVVIDWTQPQAQLGVMLTLTPQWRLYGGGSYGKLDGEERAGGTVNHTLAFERGARAGSFIGLDLTVDADGYVGVEARSGVTRYGEIYFKRRY